MTDKPSSEFEYFELTTDPAGLTDGRPFDGMAEGEFEDMWGRAIKLKGEDWPAYLGNTLAAIEATRTESGELVGLPIDAQGHDNGDGAGWIVGITAALRASPDGGRQINIFRFTPRWTALGKELIGSGVRRMFSPTVDTNQKVILGGSLTNWPATRSENGRVLLRPIELSQKGASMDETKLEEAAPVELVQPVTPEPPAPASPPAELAANPELSAWVSDFVQRQIKAGVEAALKLAERKAGISALCAQLTGGTEEAPRGLPVPADELEAFLLSLDAKTLETATAILSKIQAAGVVDFSEKGHGKQLKALAAVPDQIKPILASYLSNGGTLEEFFVINQAELGNQADYDLSAYQPKKE